MNKKETEEKKDKRFMNILMLLEPDEVRELQEHPEKIREIPEFN